MMDEKTIGINIFSYEGTNNIIGTCEIPFQPTHLMISPFNTMADELMLVRIGYGICYYDAKGNFWNIDEMERCSPHRIITLEDFEIMRTDRKESE